MRAYAGYGVNYRAFWEYYNNSSKVNYSQYSRIFDRCFQDCINRHGIGYCSNHVNLVAAKLTPICRDTRTAMLSNGVPDAAIKHITSKFKKWIVSYYV